MLCQAATAKKTAKKFSRSKDPGTRDDSQRRFLAQHWQHSVPTSLRHSFEWLQHCSNIATLCCAKNRRCESSRVTSSQYSKKQLLYISLTFFARLQRETSNSRNFLYTFYGGNVVCVPVHIWSSYNKGSIFTSATNYPKHEQKQQNYTKNDSNLFIRFLVQDLFSFLKHQMSIFSYIWLYCKKYCHFLILVSIKFYR